MSESITHVIANGILLVLYLHTQLLKRFLSLVINLFFLIMRGDRVVRSRPRCQKGDDKRYKDKLAIVVSCCTHKRQTFVVHLGIYARQIYS